MSTHLDHLVIGCGEVGRAVFEVLDNGRKAVGLRDTEPFDVQVRADTVHVCFPYSDGFEVEVADYAVEYDAALVVVHSTVPVGTCDDHGWVHSPVRGKHPELADGLRTFVKWFGSADASKADDAARAWRSVSRVGVMPSASDCEAAKLWELVQYGVNIKVEKEIHEWCDKYGLDFDFVYHRMAVSYNNGYGELGHAEFVRPVIEHVDGPIGGHCVRENADRVGHWLGDWVAR